MVKKKEEQKQSGQAASVPEEQAKTRGTVNEGSPNDSQELSAAERKEVADNIERNIGFAKRWQNIQELMTYVQNQIMFDPDKIIFGTTSRKLNKYLKSLIRE